MRTWKTSLLTAVAALMLLGGSLNAQEEESMATETPAYMNIPIETITGDSTSLAEWKGKVILVVNVASKCGFTHQYEGLEALQREYGDRGFTVVGFPANNFMNQEPGTNKEILTFCKETFNVTFPMMAKISVKGKDQHPLYTYLTEDSPFPGKITWNFNKFLIAPDGTIAARFDTKTEPESDEVVAKIEELLPKKG